MALCVPRSTMGVNRGPDAPPDNAEVPMNRPYRRIACCIDRDEMAGAVLDEAVRLADGAVGSLRIVHVVAPPRAVVAGPFSYVAPMMEVREEAETWLQDITRRIPGATPVLLDGHPAREVCAWARSGGVDLIVAAACRGFAERTMLGGFASYLAYHGPCSVLLVHRPSEGQTPAELTGQTAGGVS